MEYIINNSYGDFFVPAEVQKQINCKMFDEGYEIRTNSLFIKWVKEHPNQELAVVNIPDNATD